MCLRCGLRRCPPGGFRWRSAASRSGAKHALYFPLCGACISDQVLQTMFGCMPQRLQALLAVSVKALWLAYKILKARGLATSHICWRSKALACGTCVPAYGVAAPKHTICCAAEHCNCAAGARAFQAAVPLTAVACASSTHVLRLHSPVHSMRPF